MSQSKEKRERLALMQYELMFYVTFTRSSDEKGQGEDMDILLKLVNEALEGEYGE